MGNDNGLKVWEFKNVKINTHFLFFINVIGKQKK